MEREEREGGEKELESDQDGVGNRNSVAEGDRGGEIE